MDSNAPGQFLGYAIQVPRALVHLLRSQPGDVVCVEVLGDVSTSRKDNSVIAEEDKSSTNSNPLTNKSTDLWKTFFNWISAINNNELDVAKTKFVLFANKSGRNGIVNSFDKAESESNAQEAITDAKSLLNDIGKDHSIWRYYDYVMNDNENILLQLIPNFNLQMEIGAGYEEIKNELTRIHFPTSQIPSLIESLSGWLHKRLTENIAAKQDARIKWEEFDERFKVLFDRSRRLELIDFTLQEPIKQSEKQEHVKMQPHYLRQLYIIECKSDEIIEAVTDYIKAKVNRDRWIEDEIIDEDIATGFQENLISFWNNKKKNVEIVYKTESENDRGKILLGECKSRQQTIRDMHPPSSTIAGTYHALANELILGWHPNWELSLKDQ